MKLLRVGAPGQEKPAILDADGKARDLSSVIGDIAGDALLPDSLAKIAAIDPSSLPVLGAGRIGHSGRDRLNNEADTRSTASDSLRLPLRRFRANVDRLPSDTSLLVQTNVLPEPGANVRVARSRG